MAITFFGLSKVYCFENTLRITELWRDSGTFSGSLYATGKSIGFDIILHRYTAKIYTLLPMVDEEPICKDPAGHSMALISSALTNEGFARQDVRWSDATRRIISPPLSRQFQANTVDNNEYGDKALPVTCFISFIHMIELYFTI